MHINMVLSVNPLMEMTIDEMQYLYASIQAVIIITINSLVQRMIYWQSAGEVLELVDWYGLVSGNKYILEKLEWNKII